jgi:hypothetical protein
LRKRLSFRYRKLLKQQKVKTREETSPFHITAKTLSIHKKCRIFKTTREKHHVTYKGNPISITADLSTETLKAKKAWNDVF